MVDPLLNYCSSLYLGEGTGSRHDVKVTTQKIKDVYRVEVEDLRKNFLPFEQQTRESKLKDRRNKNTYNIFRGMRVPLR